MSLFDVLRYPISDFPTDEELKNLPPEIRQILAEEIFNVVENHKTSMRMKVLGPYIRICLRQKGNRERALRGLDKARKAIRDLP